MSNDLLRIVKIASSSRLSDRYVTVQIKNAPEQEQSETQGRFCALIEIEGSWQSNAQLGQTIINTASRQYFRGNNRDVIGNFESALKHVNESLKQATHTGMTDWIGHLHAALIIVVRNEIHIATTGQIYAKLFRDHQATPMIDETPVTETSPMPNKIFGTLLSGTIEPGDQLLVASSGLSRLLTNTEIESLFAETKAPLDASHRLGTLLRAKRGQWINALIIDTTQTDKHAKENETITLDGSGAIDWRSQTAQILFNSRRFLKPASDLWQKALANSKVFVGQQIVPKSKENLENTKTWSANKIEHLKHDTIPNLKAISTPMWQKLQEKTTSLFKPKPVEIETQLPPKPKNDSLTDNLIGRSIYAIKDYSSLDQKENNDQKPTITEYQQPIEVSTKPKTKLPNFNNLTKFVVKMEWRPIVFGLIAIILLAILLTNIRVITKQKQTEQSKQQLSIELQQLQDKLEEARLAGIFNQPDKAATALQIVLDGLPELVNSDLKKEAEQLQVKTLAQLDTLTQTKRITSLNKVTTVKDATRFAFSSDKIALTNIDGTQLTLLQLSDKSLKTIPIPSDQKILSLTAYDKKPGFAILTNQPAVYELGIDKLDLLSLQNNSNWKTGIAITSFFNNLYILSPNDNQIWKYSLIKSAYGKADGFVSDGTKIENSLNTSIDGQLYILKADGQIIRFNRGKKDDFALTAPPKPTSEISAAKQLMTTPESNLLYLLDGGRILSFDKTGKYQSQYAFNEIDSIDSFMIDENKKTIYLLSKGIFYTASF